MEYRLLRAWMGPGGRATRRRALVGEVVSVAVALGKRLEARGVAEKLTGEDPQPKAKKKTPAAKAED